MSYTRVVVVVVVRGRFLVSGFGCLVLDLGQQQKFKKIWMKIVLVFAFGDLSWCLVFG